MLGKLCSISTCPKCVLKSLGMVDANAMSKFGCGMALLLLGCASRVLSLSLAAYPCRSPFSTLSQVVVLDGIILSTGLDSTSHVVCEIFDYDPIGSDDFLGRFTAVPLLRTKVYIALWILLLFLCFVCL